MNQQQFIDYIKSPEILDSESTYQLESLVKEYPYCQSADVLLTLSLYKENNIKFGNQLKTASAYASDRRLLKQLLNTLKHGFDHKQVASAPASENSYGEIGVKDEKSKNSSDYSDHHVADLLNLLQGEVNALLIRVSQNEVAEQQFSTLKNIAENLEKLVERKESKKKTGFLSDPLDQLLVSEYSLDHLTDSQGKENKMAAKEALIDKFIQEEPKISPKNKAEFFDPVDFAKQSLIDNEEIVTETLADIYYKQGNLAKAIKTYKKLSLLYPKKSSYFAAQIEKIQKEIK